jgi:hypothetical protein
MTVDTKLDDENKENNIVHNLENINNNLAEDETPRNVEIVGSILEEIGNDCQKDSISKPGPILEPRETSLSFSEEKIKLIENQVKSNVKDAHFEPNTKKSSATESENNNIIKCVHDEQAQTVSISNVKNHSEFDNDEHDNNSGPSNTFYYVVIFTFCCRRLFGVRFKMGILHVTFYLIFN